MIERGEQDAVSSAVAPGDRPSLRWSAVGLVGWILVVALGAGLVAALNARGPSVYIDAPPLKAIFETEVTRWVVATVAVALVTTAFGPWVARVIRWRALLVLAPFVAALWSVVLALARGSDRLTHGVRSDGEYLAVLPEVHGTREFLSGFVDHLAGYPVHVQGHPPGFVVVLDALDSVGLGGAPMASALSIIAAALAVPAVLLAMRSLADEDAARRAAPFLVMAPAAMWAATSGDGFFLGVSAWAVALVVIAFTRQGRSSDVLAAVGGLLFGVTAFLSYGLVLLGAIPLVVAWSYRRVRPIWVAACGAAPVFVAFAAAGFWWPAGFLATRERYFDGISVQRPYLIFLFANLAAFAIALGPAIGPALASLRDRAVWLLVVGALICVAIADLSGMSKGEVERIWLPFTPWVLVAASSLGWRNNHMRVWLGAQVSFAILLEVTVLTSW